MHTCAIDSSIYEWKIFHNLHYFFYTIKGSRLTQVDRRKKKQIGTNWTKVSGLQFAYGDSFCCRLWICCLNIARTTIIWCAVKRSNWLPMKNCTHNHSYTHTLIWIAPYMISMKHWSDFGFSESTFNILSTRFGIQLHKCVCWILRCVFFLSFFSYLFISSPPHIFTNGEHLANRPNPETIGQMATIYRRHILTT